MSDAGPSSNIGQEKSHSTPAQRFNSLVSELQLLGRRQPLQGDEYQRAMEIMAYLRKSGFTSAEVSDLSGGKWQETTVKKYTRGVNKQDSAFRDDAINYLLRMVAMNLTLDDLKQFIKLNIAILGKGSSIDITNIALFVGECRKGQLSVKDLLEMYSRLQGGGTNQESVAISISQLKDIFSYKIELDKLGITENDLEQLVLATKQYGQNMPAVLEAINRHGQLAAILEETENRQAQCSKLDAKIDALKKQVSDLEVQKNNLAVPLAIFNDLLKPSGFDEVVLVKIADAANKQRVDIKSVVEAINDYIRLTEINRELDGLHAKKVSLESDIKAAEAKNAHIQTLLDMCDTLLYKFKFSVTAIEDLVNVAKGYGEYVNVLHALAKYGEIKKINEDLAKGEREKSRLEAEISELKKRLPVLEGQADRLSDLIKGAILHMGQEYQKGASQLAAVYESKAQFLAQESEQAAKRKASEIIFEEELRLARIVAAIIKYPNELLDLPVDYAVTLLDGVIRFCRARGINPKISLINFLGIAFPDVKAQTPVDALYMLNQARALISSGMR